MFQLDSTSYIVEAESLQLLKALPSESMDLVYIDPPFNTGETRVASRVFVEASEDGDRVGFGGKLYKETAREDTMWYEDTFTDYLAFLFPHLEEIRRVLKPEGSFFLHLDYREVHYCKVWLDRLFGRDCFQNEIIWAYDFGGRSKSRWSRKHDSILWYSKHPKKYTFNYEAIDRIPYMAPGLVGKEKAARGKTPTTVWWQTIVPTNGAERTGYPTQKPIKILDRIIAVHSNEGDWVLDCFAGSGTTGEAAGKFRRNFLMCDSNPQAIGVMEERLAEFNPTRIGEADL